MNKIWIACDWHLWNRKNNYSHPYRSISSIGKLSDNYTAGISPTDIFIHLGDIADPEKADKEKLKAIIQSIPAGYKVLCKGNHDTEPDDYYYSLGFDTVCEICTLYNVVLSHFPVKVNEDEVNVHAHLHSEKLSSLGYQHINAYKANFNDGPTSLDDLLDTAIFQDEAEYKSTDMVHYEKKFTEYTSAMFGNRFTQIVDISDRVPLAPIEESAKPQLDDSDADTILNEILFDDVEDTQYWMADDDTYQDTIRTIDYPGNRKTITNESATNKNDHVDTIKINHNEIEVYRKESINPNDPVGKEAHDLAFYMEGKKIADISISAVKSKVAFVYNFEVKPKYRNQGIGSAIFKYVMSKYHINELTVDKTNTGAIKFYKRFGFKVSQEFTEDNIKRLDMKIRLNEATDNPYGFKNPEDLHRWMRKNIKYANFNTLMNQDDVITSHKGSCHDQVAFAYPILKKMGLHPKILFFIEYREGSDEGGMTHSLIYYEKNGKIYWFENAWNGMQGIHQYDSVEDLKKQIIRMHNNMPSSKKFPDLEFKQIPFSKFKKGSNLGDFVGSIMNEAADVSEYADIYMSRITELTDNANQDESMFKHISKLTHVPVEQLPKFSPKLTVKTDKQLCFEMLPSNTPWKIKVEYERFLLKIIKKLNKTKADLPYTGTIWTADGDCLLYVNLNDTPMNEMYLSSLSATGAHAEEILNDDTESLKEMTPEEKKKIADKYGLKSTGVYREKETEANKTAEDRKKERDQKRLEDLKKARKIHKRNTRIRRIKKKIPFIKNESMGNTAVDTDINSLYDQPPTEQGGLFDGQIRYFHGLYDSEAYVETTMRSTVQHDYVKKGSKNLNSFKRVKVTKDWIKRYKDRYPRLKHLRESDDINTTYAWMDKDDLVAVLNVAVDDKSIKWISNLEVTPDYRGYGLSSQLLDYATKNLKATHLGVADDNALAIDIYKKYGFHFTNEKHNHIQIMSLSGKSQSIQESYQFELLDYNSEAYVENESAISTGDPIFDKIVNLNKKLNTFTYGLNKPGQTGKIKKQNTTSEDYDNFYHMASPEVFIKQEGGICWDFATYEASVFSKEFAEISYETYYIVFDIQPDYPSHTFLVFRYNGKYCFFESSFKRIQGIWISDKLSDIFNFILHEMSIMHNERLMPYVKNNEYRIFKYNALNHRLYGQRAGRYMDIVESEGTIVKHRYNDKFSVTKYDSQKSIQESYQFELLDNVKFVEPLQESVEEYKDEPLYPVYIMLIHSGSALANAIKFMTQSNFSHSSISFDASMTNMYSFGRKADTNPFAGGFKKESIKSQFYTSRTIPYALYMVACTKSQVDQMKKRLNYFIKNSSKFKYDFTGLFKNYFGIADNPEYQWFCSRFVADILNAGRPGEHPYVVEPSLMRPEDFMHTTYAHYVTGGVLSNYDVKAVEKKVKTMLKLERMNRILEAQKMAVNEASNMLDESVKAHTETLYRVTYHGIGIYEAFKKACSFDEWKAFKDSDAATWLDVPTIYNHDIDHASYFTKKGYEAFKKNTYPVMIQKLNKNDIKVDKVSVDTKPVYTDRYQVVIPTVISETVVFDLDPFNPFQSATLKYQLSQMDESATEQFLDYIRSFKIRIDKNGNIRVTRREYDQLDQHFRRSVRITKAAVKAGNTAMVKDELCKVYYMVSLIDNHYSKLPPVTADPKQKQVRKDLLDLRSVMLNMFNQNLKYVTVAEPNFNFNSYYAASKYGKDVTIPKQIVTAVGKTIITLL